MAAHTSSTLTRRPDLEYERRFLAQGLHRIAGVDEVGRGSWAGPIVAAAVILPITRRNPLRDLAGVTDSKQLPPPTRERLFALIMHHAISVGLGWSSHHSIDRLGIGRANTLALMRAVSHLSPAADAILVDYFRLPECGLPQASVVKGDQFSLSIASASIVAKVIRDRWMVRWDSHVPGYGFALHKGYGTARHRRALEEHGPSRIHRLSFRPMAQIQA